MPKRSTTSGTYSPQLQLRTLAQRLKVWRRTRRAGQPIPDELWNAAVNLAHAQGLSPTARALGLSYGDLRRRVLGQCARAGLERIPAGFVELAAPTAGSSLEQRGTLELTHRSGARLSIHLPNARPRDWLGLVRLFLRQRS